MSPATAGRARRTAHRGATMHLHRLPFCGLPLQQECLWELTFTTKFERSEVFVQDGHRGQNRHPEVVMRLRPYRGGLEGRILKRPGAGLGRAHCERLSTMAR